MFSSSCVMSEEQFQCPICLDVFTDPVTTPCGHNFCRNCITHHWNVDKKCKCPLCARVFHTRPELHINTFISRIAAQVRQAAVIKASSRSVESVEKKLAQLLGVIEEKQKMTENQAESFINELKKEISELRRRSAEMEHFLYTDNYIEFLQSFPSLSPAPANKYWTEVRVYSSCEGTVKSAVINLEGTLLEEIKKICVDTDLKRVQRFAVDVTLDPDTASPYLTLTQNKKKVYYGKKQSLPNKVERFSKTTCVLGKESCSAGKFYYEVQVKGKTAFDLGVALRSINRKVQIRPGSQTDLWVFSLRNGNQYRALSGSSVLFSLKSKPDKVGVFVDYEEGLVSFYDADSAALIYSFIGCNFTDKLFPIFGPCNKSSGDNTAPLVITPVKQKP